MAKASCSSTETVCTPVLEVSDMPEVKQVGVKECMYI